MEEQRKISSFEIQDLRTVKEPAKRTRIRKVKVSPVVEQPIIEQPKTEPEKKEIEEIVPDPEPEPVKEEPKPEIKPEPIQEETDKYSQLRQLLQQHSSRPVDIQPKKRGLLPKFLKTK